MEFDGLSQVTSMLATGQQIVEQMPHQEGGLEPVRNTLLPPPVQHRMEEKKNRNFMARQRLLRRCFRHVMSDNT
jgi:hypothetical protein